MAEAGVDAWVTNRVGSSRKLAMRANRTLQFVWRGATDGTSAAAAEGPGVLTHTLDTHYSSPDGFDWESRVKPSLAVTPANANERALALVEVAKERGAWYRTRHLLLPFGEDFRFQRAEHEFGNMTQIVDAANRMADATGIEFRYSTASEYFAAVASDGAAFPLRAGGSLLPLVDDGHPGAWTGFYSGYPALKRRIREGDELAAAALAAVAFDGSSVARTAAQAMSEEASIAQHHDAIPFTGYPFNNRDYAERLERASPGGYAAVADAAERLLATGASSSLGGWSARLGVAPSDEVVGISEGVGADLIVAATTSGLGSLRQTPRREIVRLLVSRPDVLVTEAATGRAVRSQVAHAWGTSESAAMPGAALASDAVYELAFIASVPAAGASAYRLDSCSTFCDTDPPFPPPAQGCAEMVVETNGAEAAAGGLASAGAALGVDVATLWPSSIGLSSGTASQNASLSIHFAAYNASTDTVYKFEGAAPPVRIPTDVISLTARRGPVASSMRFEIAGGFAMTLEACADATATDAGHFGIEWTTPPATSGQALAVAIAVDGGQAASTFPSGAPAVLEVEENGMVDYIVRGRFDASQPIGHSYRPITGRARVALPGGPTGWFLALEVEAAVGGTSPAPGQIELTLQRRMEAQVGIDPTSRVDRGVDVAGSRRRARLGLSYAVENDGDPGAAAPPPRASALAPLMAFARQRGVGGAPQASPLARSAQWLDPGAIPNGSSVTLVAAWPAVNSANETRVGMTFFNAGHEQVTLDLDALLAPLGGVTAAVALAADGIQSAEWVAARRVWPVSGRTTAGSENGAAKGGLDATPVPCSVIDVRARALSLAPRQLCTVGASLGQARASARAAESRLSPLGAPLVAPARPVE